MNGSREKPFLSIEWVKSARFSTRKIDFLKILFFLSEAFHQARSMEWNVTIAHNSSTILWTILEKHHFCQMNGSNQPDFRHEKSIFSKLYVFYPELFSTLAQWYGMQLLRIIPLRSYERFSRKTIFVGFRGFLIWGTSVEKLEMSDKCIWPDIHTQRNSMVVPRTCSFFYVDNPLLNIRSWRTK